MNCSKGVPAEKLSKTRTLKQVPAAGSFVFRKLASKRYVWLHEMPEVQFISPFLEYLSRFKFRFGTVGLLEFLRCRSSSVFLLKNKPANESSELRHYLNVCREVIWSSHITSISDKTKRSYCQHKRRPRGARTATLQLSLSLKLDVEITS